MAVLLIVVLGGCAAPSSITMTKEAQQAMTPDQALERLREGNDRFAKGASTHRDYPAQVRATANGQYPYAVVLSCIDSRCPPEILFDEGLGDIFVPRVAGNYAPVDLVGSMEFATRLAGAKLVVVLGHTECGAIKGACDGAEMGNLTTVIAALQPAVSEVQGVEGPRTSSNPEFVQAVTERNVRRTVETIRTDSPILREMEQSGQLEIVGAIYDVRTGRVQFLN
ncbi:MAG: hypothetical protein KDA22_15615 [Phycisphaerales bacterium]|nr:hypothetical protein [Phycisphaerales bacterium]